ncbi:MAG: DUF3656 domain-containing U32 family peptidase [Blautia caecimuris]
MRKQMDKLGNTEFEWDESGYTDGTRNIFCPVKTIK